VVLASSLSFRPASSKISFFSSTLLKLARSVDGSLRAPERGSSAAVAGAMVGLLLRPVISEVNVSPAELGAAGESVSFEPADSDDGFGKLDAIR
jgi:hypothetical protein